MKIKNVFLASLLTTLGQKVTAELTVDDVNGTAHSFPDINEISEIAEGVAISSPDDTYIVADGEDTLTIVVVGGLVASVTRDTPAPGDDHIEGALDEEMQAVLTALVEASTSNKETIDAQAALITGLKKEITDFKASFKHDKGDATPAASTNARQFKTV